MNSVLPSAAFWNKAFRTPSSRCIYCPEERAIDFTQPPDDYLISSIDHLVPVSLGGGHHPENVVPACIVCNFYKKDLVPHEFGDWTEVRGDGMRYVRPSRIEEYVGIMRLIIASEKNSQTAEYRAFRKLVEAQALGEDAP